MVLENGHQHQEGGAIEVSSPEQAAHLVQHYNTFLFDVSDPTLIRVSQAADNCLNSATV